MSTKVPYLDTTIDVLEEVELSEEAAELLADRVAAKMSGATPQRSHLGDVPTKSGDRPSAFYGGYDKYAEAGTTDAEVATNLYIARVILSDPKTGESRKHDWTGDRLVSDRLNEVMVNAATKALGQDAPTIPAYVSDAGYTKAIDADGFVVKGYGAMRARAKAMTSTGANEGDEWVPTFATAELWRDVHLATEVSANIRRVNMPTNPYTLPTLDSDVTFYYAPTENQSVTGTNPNTGAATLTARKIQADVSFSGEVTEDSIIPATPAIRANLVRRGAQTIDDLIVHGDTETGGTGNVNTDDGAPAAGSFYLAIDGMRKFCLVTNTGQVKAFSAAPSTALIAGTRALLGRYGARASDLRIVTGYSTTNTLLDLEEVQTVDKYGPNATLVRGELARIFGVPILTSEAIPGTATDKVDDDGKYSVTSPSTNDTDGWLLIYNTNGWTQGFRREFQIESDRNIQTDTNILVASFRMALIPSGISTLHTAIGYDITVL